MKRLIIFKVLILVSCLCNAKLSVEYSPKNINIGDTVQLVLTIDSATKIGSPNLMPLIKDFNILSTQRSFSFADVNGKTTSQAQWTLVLKPKRTGKLVIPAITIGDESSKPIEIDVKQSSVNNQPKLNNDSKYTIIEAKTNQPNPFINQQIIYSVKLYNRQQLFDGQYKAPEVDNALIVPLGEGKHYQTSYQGEFYEVEAIDYAIFPQKPGKLTILPPEFAAEVIDGFSPTKLHISAKPVTLDVKPLPSNVTLNEWLAAQEVHLQETYDNPKVTNMAGDTIVREVTLEATGIVSQLLPKLSFENSENYNIYVDKPILENSLVDGKIISKARYKITYLLTKAGNINLPAISVPWYNIDTQTNLSASLPPKTIHITPSTTSKVEPQPQIPLAKEPQPTKHWPLSTIFAILLGLSILSYLIVAFRNIKRKPREINPSIANIQKACKSQNPQLARQALLAFARKEWPAQKILNLNDIPITSQEFKQEVAKLTQALYSKEANDAWDGKEFWQVFAKIKFKKNKNKNSKKNLPPIYLH